MADAEPFRVLVVDDDPDTRVNLCDILELDGYHVEAVSTAADALARDDWQQLGAVLLDRKLPDATAEDVMPQLRQLAPDLAVMIVTGYADMQSAIAAFRLGATDYILKPVDPDELRKRLSRIADSWRTRQELRTAHAAREQALTDLRSKTEELRATTQQLWQAARLAGVGELAASIAHELNNPLGIISLRIEGVLAKTPRDDPRHRALEVVEQEIERMAGLVSNLLHFSRAGRDQVSTVNVHDEVTRTIELTSHHLRSRQIQVETDVASDVPVIFADRQHLRQVFLNLFTNAADAMDEGGTLTLRVHPSQLSESRAAVKVEVTDTGVGIPPEHMARVTDPFFTTKPEGKGTGLGLAICRRIVQQHQGTLHVESQQGRGTTVRIVLPVRPDANVVGLRDD